MSGSKSSRQSGLRSRQVDFSLVQLRLVGLLIILQLVGRLIVALPGMAQAAPMERQAALLMLSNWLPILPLGISLYLLGAGHQRQSREQWGLTLLSHSLYPLGLAFVGLIPVVLIASLKAAQGAAVAQVLTPYQQELISATRVLTAIVLSVLTGIGFLLLHRQMKSALKRYQLTPQMFFRSRNMRLKTGSQI